jgi:catechol 2,3-dioxygenase-like lactoylglutathione lyase family enzyme
LVRRKFDVSVIAGLNHVAVLTADLERFIDFYTRMFELEVVFVERTPTLRHAILRLGKDSWLHPAETPGNPHSRAVPAMFQRGHLDHLSLTAASAQAFERLRTRLVHAQASDGRIDDLGAFHSIWFEDPDGMRGEVVLIVNDELSGIHEPRPLGAARTNT